MKWPEATLKGLICTTVQEAIKSGSCALGEIKRIHEDSAVFILTLLISELVLFFNVGKNMGAIQIKMTIDLILQDLELKNLKPEDFKVCFTDMKKGRYGPLFDRLDGQVIIEILYKYSQEKLTIIEQDSISKANKEKAESLKQPITPGMLEALKTIAKEIPKEVEKEKPLNKLSTNDPVVTQIFAEFDAEWKRAPVKGIGRFVLVDGKKLNQVEYLEYKFGLKK